MNPNMLYQQFKCTTPSQLAGNDGNRMVCSGLNWVLNLKRLFTEAQPDMPTQLNSTYEAIKYVIKVTMPEPTNDSVAMIVHECCEHTWSVMPKARETVMAFYSAYCAHVDSGSAHDLEISAMWGAVFSTFFQGAISAATRATSTANDAPPKYSLTLTKAVDMYVSSLTIRYGSMFMSTIDTKLPEAVDVARGNVNLQYSIADYGSETEVQDGSKLAKLICVTDEDLAIKDLKIVAEVHERGRMTRSAIVYRAALDALAPNMTLLQISPDIASEALQCVSMGANLAEWGPRTWICSLNRWEVQQFLVATAVAKLMADRLDIPLEKNETGNIAAEYPNSGKLLVDFGNSLDAVPAWPHSKIWNFTAMYEMFGERHSLFARYLDATGKDAKAEHTSVLNEMRACNELDSLCEDHCEIVRNATDSIHGMLRDSAAVECTRMCEDTMLMKLAKTAVIREAFNTMLSNPYSAFEISLRTD
ncbi:hypothetical protein BG015_005170 [Linnemannia schmuckeri]|uniref:Uncharacterized protein n=1 Tax=Linnemannia schmuckeri TaxID=64567 RepID=A0A9P5VEZ6_9FUNG|nr:hypothetical protein BG015_005170 [Linnemannia schmuckeri]